MMSGSGDGWWVLMWVPMALFWLFVIAGVVWLIALLSRRPGRRGVVEEPLRRRLASGEIDVDQYRALRDDLGPARNGRTPGPGVAAPLALTAVFAAAVVFLVAGGVALAARADWGWGMGNHMRGMMGGGTNSANAPVTAGSAAESVAIRDFAFSPGNLQVPVGATVKWTNSDSAPHTATAKDGGWDTGTLKEGETKTLTFDSPGHYLYYCTIHPSMQARLTVR